MKRTTINTIDHGAVALVCPAWCVGGHEDGGYRIDITHVGPEHTLDVASLRGPVELLTFVLEQRPFTQAPPGRRTFMNVGVESDLHPQNAASLHQLADSLRLHAASIDAHADVLAELQNGDPR